MKNLLFLLIILTTSCGLSESQLSKKMPLRQLVKTDENNTYKSGGFFLISGTYSEYSRKESFVKVFAKVEGGYRFIKMPMHLIKVFIDNKIKTPYIQIKYRYSIPENRNRIKDDDDILKHGYIEMYHIYCPEIYLPEKLIPIEL